MEPNSVDACAFTVLKSSFAARSSISIGFVAFGRPLRSPYSTTLEATCPIRAQRQNGGALGEERAPPSTSAGEAGEVGGRPGTTARWGLLRGRPVGALPG